MGIFGVLVAPRSVLVASRSVLVAFKSVLTTSKGVVTTSINSSVHVQVSALATAAGGCCASGAAQRRSWVDNTPQAAHGTSRRAAARRLRERPSLRGCDRITRRGVFVLTIPPSTVLYIHVMCISQGSGGGGASTNLRICSPYSHKRFLGKKCS